jgi:hypothetical protein
VSLDLQNVTTPTTLRYTLATFFSRRSWFGYLEENTMKTLRTIAAITALAGACFSFAAPAMAELRDGEVVRIIVYPDGTTVY